MSGLSPIESISAVTLATTDMGAATRFYDAIGFERLYGGPDAAFTSFQIGPERLEVIDLPVERDHEAPIAGVEGLRSRHEVDDRKPAMAESDASFEPGASGIGPSAFKLVGHAVENTLRSGR